MSHVSSFISISEGTLNLCLSDFNPPFAKIIGYSLAESYIVLALTLTLENVNDKLLHTELVERNIEFMFVSNSRHYYFCRKLKFMYL